MSRIRRIRLEFCYFINLVFFLQTKTPAENRTALSRGLRCTAGGAAVGCCRTQVEAEKREVMPAAVARGVGSGRIPLLMRLGFSTEKRNVVLHSIESRWRWL